jgi:hypothetical protein
MALGYTLQAVLGFVIGGANEQIQKVFPLFVVLYGIFLTLGEVGPGRSVQTLNRLTSVKSNSLLALSLSWPPNHFQLRCEAILWALLQPGQKQGLP